MPEDRDDLLRHYFEMRAGLLEAIAGLSDDQLSERTLDGWSVKDHLLHLALWDDIRAGGSLRSSEGHESAWRMSGEQDGIYSTLGHALRRELSVAQARWELAMTQGRLMGAIAGASERGLNGSLYGEAGLKSTHEA